MWPYARASDAHLWILVLDRRTLSRCQSKVPSLGDMVERGFSRVVMRPVSEKLWHFRHKSAVFIAPIENEFILVHQFSFLE